MYYVVNKLGEVIASSSGPVNVGMLGGEGSIAVTSDIALPPYDVAVADFPDAPRIIERPRPALGALALFTTAVDADGDGVPELRANGKDATAINVDATHADGSPVAVAVPVTFRTTAGRLSARVVELDEGTASVQLTAGRETVAVTITATAPGFAPARLELEFVP